MLTVRLRLGGVLAHWWLKERRAPATAVSRLPLRCWWTDCDINRHMNNSRYLALMDVGRWHFLLATRLYQPMLELGWAPVAVRVEIDYKKSLKPGDRFILETTQEKVGTKSATLRQRFLKDGEVCAEARVVVLFVHKGKSQELAPLMARLPHLAAAREPEPV